MDKTESTEPNPSRPAFVVVAGRAAPPRNEGRGRFEPRTGPGQAAISFDRRELKVLFDLYGAKVAAGEWRDYALDFTPAKAVFSIFRRASEEPLYRIEKNPELARRQGAYAVIATTGLVLRRGHDLARVVRALDSKLKLVGVE
jgi:hypothetical protein